MRNNVQCVFGLMAFVDKTLKPRPPACGNYMLKNGGKVNVYNQVAKSVINLALVVSNW